MVFAWLLLGELPRAVQFLGGLLILVGSWSVKLGERDTQAAPVDTGQRRREKSATLTATTAPTRA